MHVFHILSCECWWFVVAYGVYAPRQEQATSIIPVQTETAGTDNPHFKGPSIFSKIVLTLRKPRKSDERPPKVPRTRNRTDASSKIVEKHVISENRLKEVGIEIATQVPSNAVLLPETAPEPAEETAESDECSTDEHSSQDVDHRVKSFVQLLGVDPYVPHRNALELFADRQRVDAEKKLGKPSKATNAAILEDLDLEHIEDYDEEFLQIWDLDSGEEMIEYIHDQIESYEAQWEQLCQEIEQVYADVKRLRRKRQDAYFRIKDLETEAAEAERRYGRLHKVRPTKKEISGAKHSRKKMVIIAALLEQREELFRSYRNIYRGHDVGENRFREEEYEVDRDLSKSTHGFQDCLKIFQRIQRDSTLRNNDLSLIHQELNYLTEELGLYVFEDDKSHHDLKMTEAIAYLSAQHPTIVPLRGNNPSKRLSTLEDSLTKLKSAGALQMKRVDDAHDEISWHLTRRGDILKVRIRDYMKQKQLRKIDRKLFKVLLLQRPNIPLLQAQIQEQLDVTEELEPKWARIKEENAALRNIIVAISSRLKSAKELEEAEKAAVKESLEKLCATYYSEHEKYGDRVDEDADLTEPLEEPMTDTWGETTRDEVEEDVKEDVTEFGDETIAETVRSTTWASTTSLGSEECETGNTD